MNKRVFVKNTAVMTATSLLLRSFGIVFRIFISNRVGAEGMGLYQLVFSVYVLGTTFASAGLTTAVTRMVAEHLARENSAAARRVLRLAMELCVVAGAAGAVVLWFGAPMIGRLIGDVRAVPALTVSGLSLPFVGISSCLKGYFMARRKAMPPCLSQVAEQAVRIGSILWMLRRSGTENLAITCRIILIGDVLSESAACLFLFLSYRSDRKKQPASAGSSPAVPSMGALLRPLLGIAVPLTAGRYLSTLLRTAENVLVPSRLTRYTGSGTVALEQFGALKGMALPLLFFPAAFLITVSGLLIPELSDAQALGQHKQVARLTRRAMRLTLPLSILIGCFFTVFGRSLGQLLYHDGVVGLLLQILGPLTPIMYLDSVSTGMLKGLGQQVRSLWYSVIDSAVRILLIWLLLPRYGMIGFLFVMVVSNWLTCVLSTGRLLTVSGTRMPWYGAVGGPILSAALAGSGWIFLRARLFPGGGWGEVVVGGIALTACYGLLLFLFGCFPPIRRETPAFSRG